MSVFWKKYYNIEEPRKTVQGEKRMSFMDLDDSCMSQTGTMNS